MSARCMVTEELGFVINRSKSQVIPSQKLEFPGFVINSVGMTIRLPPRKMSTIVEVCNDTHVVRNNSSGVTGLKETGVQFSSSSAWSVRL